MKKGNRTIRTNAAWSSGPVFSPWFEMGWSAWSLGMEASSVIALRMLRLAGGGNGGAKEARRMISEKIESGVTLPAKLFSARAPRGAAAKAIDRYRPKVRANLRRLSKKK